MELLHFDTTHQKTTNVQNIHNILMKAQMDKPHSTYISQLEKCLNQIKLCVHVYKPVSVCEVHCG